MNSDELKQDDEIALGELLTRGLEIIADNVRILVLTPIILGASTIGITFLIPPTYTATTTLLPAPNGGGGAEAAFARNLGALGGLGAMAGIKNPIDQYIGLLKSQSVLEALVKRFELVKRYEVKTAFDAQEVLLKKTAISGGKDGLVVIKVDDYDPKFSADLANAYSVEINQLLNRMVMTEAKQRRIFFEKQLLENKEKLVLAEQALSKSGISSAALKASGGSVAGLAQLEGQVTAAEVRLASLKSYLAQSAPEVQQAETALASLRSKLDSMKRPETQETGEAKEYLGRVRDLKYYEAISEIYARQFEMAKLDEAKESMPIQVVDPAKPPERRSSPKRLSTGILVAVLGEFVLLLSLFMRPLVGTWFTDPHIRSQFVKIRNGLRIKKS